MESISCYCSTFLFQYHSFEIFSLYLLHSLSNSATFPTPFSRLVSDILHFISIPLLLSIPFPFFLKSIPSNYKSFVAFSYSMLEAKYRSPAEQRSIRKNDKAMTLWQEVPRWASTSQWTTLIAVSAVLCTVPLTLQQGPPLQFNWQRPDWG